MRRSCLLLLFLIGALEGSLAQKTFRSIEKASEAPKKVFTLKLIQDRPEEKDWKAFEEFTNLNELYLEDVLLDTLPRSMSALKRMTKFQSKQNPIAHFPDTLKNWKALTYMELVEPKLDTFPKICAYWGKLREIGINKNRAEEMLLPPAIGTLDDLRLLAINQSPLAPLPDTLTDLPELQKLILKDCGIEKFPGGMEGMEKLELLVLEKNELKEIPSSIGALKELEYLSLKGNLLETIPQSISGCSALKKLDIRNNYFSAYQLDILKALLPDTEILHDPIEEKGGKGDGSP